MSHKRRLVSSSEDDDILPSLPNVFDQDTDVESVQSAGHPDQIPIPTLQTATTPSSAVPRFFAPHITCQSSGTAHPESPTKRTATLVGMEAYASDDDDVAPTCEIESETISIKVLPATPPPQMGPCASIEKPKRKKGKKAKRDREPEPVPEQPAAKAKRTEIVAKQPAVQLCPLPLSVAGLPRIPRLSKAKPVSPVRPQRAAPIVEEFPLTFVSRVTNQKLARLKAATEQRTCPDCGATFDRHGKMMAHVRRAHTLVAVCICGYRSLCRDNVTRHQRTMARRGTPHLKVATVSVDQEKEFKERFCRPMTVPTTIIGEASDKDTTAQELQELRKRVQELEEKMEAIKAALK